MSKEKKICSVEGCEREAKAKGFCNMHLQRYERYGSPDIVKIMRTLPGEVCSIYGCNNPIDSRKLCKNHYEQYRRHGDPLHADKNKNKPKKKCKIDGCDRDLYSLGFCSIHYKRFKKNGDPLIKFKERKKKHPETCTVENCLKKSATQGLCSMHYARKQKYVDPLKTRPTYQCDYPGCNNIRMSPGLCTKHHEKDKREKAKKLPNKYSVYICTNKIDGRVYIGMTSMSLTKRRHGHYHFAFSDNPPWQGPLHKDLKKLGKDSFEWKVDSIFDEEIEAHKREAFLIKENKSTDRKYGYNILNGELDRSLPNETVKRMVSNKKILKGSMHPMAKIDEDMVFNIKNMIKNGYKYKEISTILNVNYSTVKNIGCNKTWRHVKLP